MLMRLMNSSSQITACSAISSVDSAWMIDPGWCTKIEFSVSVCRVRFEVKVPEPLEQSRMTKASMRVG